MKSNIGFALYHTEQCMEGVIFDLVVLLEVEIYIYSLEVILPVADKLILHLSYD